jgi:hypothetical protein
VDGWGGLVLALGSTVASIGEISEEVIAEGTSSKLTLGVDGAGGRLLFLREGKLS